MPSADVQYCLDGAIESLHIAGDTYFYMMEMEPDADRIYDAISAANVPQRENYWSVLAEHGLELERRYVDWRAHHPQFKLASFMGLKSVPHLMDEIINTASPMLAEADLQLDQNGITYLDQRFGFGRAIEIMRRTVRRGMADFAGSSERELLHTQHLVEIARNQNREEEARATALIMQNMHTTIDETIVSLENLRKGIDFQQSIKTIREKKRQDRRIITRSYKFLSKLIGGETTRTFIQGDRIRIEGHYAIYEILRTSSLMDSHGGFRALKVFDKDHPEIHLCDVCVYTKGVPLLDHVASLIMHIRAGEELEILTKGNPHSGSERAQELEWLAPMLPKPLDFGALNAIRVPTHDGRVLTDRERMVVDQNTEKLRPLVSRYVTEQIMGDAASLIRTMKNFITIQ